MYSRKITFNRRRQRIGNLITGVLKHFGKSSAENITENVLKCSNQQMDYVSSAVRRALRCGTEWGYLVKTGDNTFCLPHQNYEIDADDPFVNLYYPADYEFCINKQLKEGYSCEALDLLTQKKCTNLTPFSQNRFCLVHMQLQNLLKYRIDFISQCTEKDLQDYLQKNYAALFATKIKEILKHKKSLLTFLEGYNHHIFEPVPNHPLYDTLFGKLEDPKFGSRGCSGKCLKNGDSCQNDTIENWFSEDPTPKLCEEHSVISLLLKGFSRSPKFTNIDKDDEYMENPPLDDTIYAAWTGPIKSFLDGRIAGKVYGSWQTLKRKWYNNNSKCMINYFVVISRFQFLKITGSKYLEYDPTIVNRIELANLLSVKVPISRCQCLNAEDVFLKFNRGLDKKKYVRQPIGESTEARFNRRVMAFKEDFEGKEEERIGEVVERRGKVAERRGKVVERRGKVVERRGKVAERRGKVAERRGSGGGEESENQKDEGDWIVFRGGKRKK
ncbi:hypothetical protein HA402_005493 [Bradysia odoriphaga]|nr:hypothetical protein HA402_005493 [Bradysia odoriphaga]